MIVEEPERSSLSLVIANNVDNNFVSNPAQPLELPSKHNIDLSE